MSTRTHGESGNSRTGEPPTPLYGIWSSMRRRCDLPTHPYYTYYGGRGIQVCDDWNTSYEAFRDWARSHGYSRELQLDRKDNNGPYSPENCHWTTAKINARNRRSNVLLAAFGEVKSLTEWTEDPRCRVNFNALRMRINSAGTPKTRSLGKVESA